MSFIAFPRLVGSVSFWTVVVSSLYSLLLCLSKVHHLMDDTCHFSPLIGRCYIYKTVKIERCKQKQGSSGRCFPLLARK